MTNGRIEYRCDNCGQTDDHPKMHYGQQQFHHDCIPAYVMDDLTSESFYRLSPDGRTLELLARVPLPEDQWHPSVPHILHLKEKAQSGVRGDTLLAYIQDNEIGG